MSGSLGEWEMLWEQQTLQGECFHSFLSSLILSRVFLWLDWNTQNMFSISFRTHCDEKRKTTCLLWSSRCKFSLLMPLLCEQLVLILCFYWVILWQSSTNQHAYFLRAVFQIQKRLIFLHDFRPQLKGLSLSNSDVIRQVHNSFARFGFTLIQINTSKIYVEKSKWQLL